MPKYNSNFDEMMARFYERHKIMDELELQRLKRKLKYEDRFLKPIEFWSLDATVALGFALGIALVLTGVFLTKHFL